MSLVVGLDFPRRWLFSYTAILDLSVYIPFAQNLASRLFARDVSDFDRAQSLSLRAWRRRHSSHGRRVHRRCIPSTSRSSAIYVSGDGFQNMAYAWFIRSV